MHSLIPYLFTWKCSTLSSGAYFQLSTQNSGFAFNIKTNTQKYYLSLLIAQTESIYIIAAVSENSICSDQFFSLTFDSTFRTRQDKDHFFASYPLVILSNKCTQ